MWQPDNAECATLIRNIWENVDDLLANGWLMRFHKVGPAGDKLNTELKRRNVRKLPAMIMEDGEVFEEQINILNKLYGVAEKASEEDDDDAEIAAVRDDRGSPRPEEMYGMDLSSGDPYDEGNSFHDYLMSSMYTANKKGEIKPQTDGDDEDETEDMMDRVRKEQRRQAKLSPHRGDPSSSRRGEMAGDSDEAEESEEEDERQTRTVKSKPKRKKSKSRRPKYDSDEEEEEEEEEKPRKSTGGLRKRVAGGGGSQDDAMVDALLNKLPDLQ